MKAPVPMKAPAVPSSRAGMMDFILLSFEGPDPFAAAGGVGVRVSGLARALAAAGYPVRLFFVGDPQFPGMERRNGVQLHRWCQALSAAAPGGVYADEERKIEDFCVWLPDHLAELVGDAAARGRTTVVLAEEWQMAWPLIAVHDELVRRRLRRHAVLAWNANHRFGFERLDFGRLGEAAVVLTVSRAMKHLMWRWGVNPLVVPNGLADDWFEPAPGLHRAALRGGCPERRLLVKVARWDPDKRWHMALEALARLRDTGRDGLLVARGWNGGPSAPHYRELRSHADHLGLAWVTCDEPVRTARNLVEVVADSAAGADVIELAFHLGPGQLRVLYRSADAVLANSGFEPFGLAGLEAMASRGIVVAGSTGEDYVVPFGNGFALETDNGGEIVRCLDWLEHAPRRETNMRQAAQRTAKRYRWEHIVERLSFSLELPTSTEGGPVDAHDPAVVRGQTARRHTTRPRGIAADPAVAQPAAPPASRRAVS